jgi:glycosyltransferase involved in cell wall biosynthesis
VTLKIGLDARAVRQGLGIARFTTELARGLVASGEVDLIWFGDPARAPHGCVKVASWAQRSPYVLMDSAIGRALAARYALDVFHFTSNTGWTTKGRLPWVLTMHDLIFMEGDDKNRGIRQRVGHAYERRAVPRAIAAASALATPSDTTRRQLVARFGLDATVIPNGVHAPNAPASTKKGGYVVAFAGSDPRKRVDVVLDAFRGAPDLPFKLVILAGAGLPEGFADKAAGMMGSTRIRVVGHVPESQLWKLLQGANALVYPSVAEGFGLPVLEAMSVGTPVVTGLAAATLEVGGDAVLRIDRAAPAASVAATLRRLAAEPELAAEFTGRGIARSARFRWDVAVRAYLDLYRNLRAE